MTRPLVITDCDEVLLYMVAPFRDWLHESQGVRFEMVGNDFAGAMKYADGGAPVPPEEIWRLLRGFLSWCAEHAEYAAVVPDQNPAKAKVVREDVHIVTRRDGDHGLEFPW